MSRSTLRGSPLPFLALCWVLGVRPVESAYQAEEVNYNWDQSKATCRTNGLELAKVDSPVKLSAAQGAFIPGKFPKKYWTGLKYGAAGFVWTDGSAAARGPQGIDGVLSPQEANRTDVRCFYVTTDTSFLASQPCAQGEKFICQTQEFPSTSAVVDTMTASASDAAVSASAGGGGQTSIVIGEQFIKGGSEPDKLIEEFVRNLEAVNTSAPSSLQQAVNMTSTLLEGLTKLKEARRGTGNVLVAIHSLERFGLRFSEVHLSSSTAPVRVLAGTSLTAIVRRIPEGTNETVMRSPAASGSQRGAVVLPRSLFQSQERHAVLVVYLDVHELLPRQIYDSIDGNPIDGLEPLTSIMSTSLSPKIPGHLRENINIIFAHEKVRVLSHPHCVFWNFSVRTTVNGTWSSRGCHLKTKYANQTVCSCNHMTSFSVLMQVRDTQVPRGHKLALEIITYIGCIFSLAGEVLTALAYIVLLKVTAEEVQIRLNLVVSLAAAHVVFLAGINATEYQAGCILVAVLLHYLFLAAFDWMLLEGCLLYLKVVKVFSLINRVRLLYVFAWGFPISMVVLSLSIASVSSEGISSYTNISFCWVSFANGLVWTFAAPVIFIVTINILIIARVLGEMTNLQNIDSKEIIDLRQGIKTCAILCPLLGVTWIFGMLSVTDAGLFFQYTFTILNSMQGFLIFLLHVVRSSDVRIAFRRKVQRWRLRRANFSEESTRSTQRATPSRNQVQDIPLQDNCAIRAAGPPTS